MKQLIVTFIFSILLTPCIMGQNSTERNSAISLTPFMKSHYCEGITLIPGNSFTKGSRSFQKYLSEDTTLLYPEKATREKVASFYISDHEVTNAEYREFVNWVRDSIARSKLFVRSAKDQKHLWGAYVDKITENKDSNGQYFVLNWDTKLDYSLFDIDFLINDMYFFNDERFYNRKEFDVRKFTYFYYDIRNGDTIPTLIHIYPDTLCWNKNEKYSFNHPMSNYYFWNHEYDNYPVVGVSWSQTQAYCDWRTKRYMEELNKLGRKKKSKYIGVKFTLPNNNQWSYASEPNEVMPPPYAKNEKGCYTSNFGNIFLNSDILIKNLSDDGAFNTIKVKSYSGNEFGLYNMFGNVSEWIQDNPRTKPENIFENLIESNSDSNDNFFSFYFPSKKIMKDTTKQGQAIESRGNQRWRNAAVDAPKQLYITDPYTMVTQLVTKDSPEHIRILEQRLHFYDISLNASIDDILKNYIAFHSVDSSFRDKILNPYIEDVAKSTEKQEQIQSTDKNSNSIEEVIDGIIIQDVPISENRLVLYNNYNGGLFQTNDKNWIEQKLKERIRELKHNWEVIERAEQIQSPSAENAIKSCRMVKGGSWLNQPHYMNSACNEVYHQSETSCEIGFRVIMEASVIEENGICMNCTAKDRNKMKKYRKAQREREIRGIIF